MQNVRDFIAQGDVKANDINCSGNVIIKGNADIKTIHANGKAEIGGDIECAHIEAAESISIAGFTTAQGLTSVNGNIIVEKPIMGQDHSCCSQWCHFL